MPPLFHRVAPGQGEETTRKTRKLTIKTMLLIPMLAINLMIVVIFAVALNVSKVNLRMRETEVANLERMAQSRGEQMEFSFNGLTGIASNMARGMQEDVFADLDTTTDITGQLRGSPEAISQALNACQPYLLNALKLNEATGAFVLLDASALAGERGGFSGEQVAALHFYDMNVTTVSQGNEDLMLYCGPKQTARELNIPLDNYWEVELRLDRIADRSYIDALLALDGNRSLSIEQMGYWTQPMLRQDGVEEIVYAVPLRDSAGRIFAIAGVEITVDYLRTKLNPAELGYADNSFYALTTMCEGDATADWLVATGAFAIRHISGSGAVTQRILPEYDGNTREMTFDDGTAVTGVIYPINRLYSGNVHDQEEWCLVAGVANRVLYAKAETLQRQFLIAFLVAMAVGILFSIFGSNIIVRPITRLAKQLHATDPNEEITLPRTRIREVDMLIDSIEELSEDLMETGHRTTMAIEMTEMTIGFLEINPTRKRVYLTDYLFGLFGLQKQGDSNIVPLEVWTELFDRLLRNAEPGLDNVYLLDFVERQPLRWLRVRTAQSGGHTYGIVIDTTDEILEKRQLEFERDTDPLTGLLNRHAFFTQAGELVRSADGKVGVMLFADLDNLKYVNDTYGHDFGDRYIRSAANVFGLYTQHGGVVSRISGDEFAVFLYGGDSREALEKTMLEVYAGMDSVAIVLPDGSEMPIRCSIGYSWYPYDSLDLDQLLKYADFAMYETKRSVKGSIREFSFESYSKNSYLLEKNEDFNQFVEQNQVFYVFQPIVDIHSGGIFAYEALMRPEIPGMDTPFKVLQIARSQAKLYQIERMTVFNLFSWLDDNLVDMFDLKLFINSIPNQLLDQRDLDELQRDYGHLLNRVVMEITEDERSEADALLQKINIIRKMGPEIAVDDFGSGYSNEVIVLASNPDYIKIDLSLVRDVHNDLNKQKLVENIISYAHPLGIRIIAEGIECYEEAETMIQLGADYLQGYYLGRPQREIMEIPEEVSEAIRDISARYRERRVNR